MKVKQVMSMSNIEKVSIFFRGIAARDPEPALGAARRRLLRIKRPGAATGRGGATQ